MNAAHLNDALLKISAVAGIVGCSTMTVYRMAADGRMPSPIKAGAMTRWRKSELDDWLAAGCPANQNTEGGVV